MATKAKVAPKSGTISPSIAKKLDLELAWRRVELDRPDRCFVTHPYLFSWIESDLTGWLDGVRRKIEAGYQPHDCLICREPKGNWMVRPGSVLDIEDELIYNAILGSFHGEIWKAIGWSQGDPDVAYQFQKSPTKPEWIKSGFLVWEQWRKKSLAKLTKGIQFVVFADISAFYETIDLNRVASDLRALNLDTELIDLLSKCLRRWSQPRDKGVPQGLSASDLLAKIYLDPIDRGLRNDGVKHIRYVDDIRIFCRNNLEAKRALLTLNELLRIRGLNVQTAKTEILRTDEARKKIDGVASVIEAIQTELSDEIRSALGLDHSYATLTDIENAVKIDPEAPPVEVLDEAFRDHFLSRRAKFDKTLFHYLLTRLAKVRSRVAVTYCLETLAARPEETKSILRYLAGSNLTDAEYNEILDYAGSKEAIYDYQLYKIVSFFLDRRKLLPKLIRLCRILAFDRNRDPWLRMVGVTVLGLAADPADLERLENHYGTATTDLERAEIVMALEKLEVSRRNAFYGRVKSDGELAKRAIESVRSGRK